MARKRREKTTLLEDNNGVIIVKCYHRDKFQKQDEKNYICSNCGVKKRYKQVYELKNNTIIDLCVNCIKKVHNLATFNPKFKKY